MNFVERIISYGFKRIVPEWENNKGRYDVNFNTQSGWMGVTIYHPLESFVKGDKRVSLDLTKLNSTEYRFDSNGVSERKVSEKRITVYENDKIIYDNVNGIMPPKEIEEKLKMN